MKPTIAVLALLSSVAHGELVITEVMAASSHPAKTSPTPDANGDWWELTNTGTASVNLTGYKWDDTPTPFTPTVSNFPSNIFINPGESIIILEEPSANVSTWKSAWGLGSDTQVIDRTQFTNMGGEGFSGLGSDGDEVNLYDANGDLAAHVEFGPSLEGVSQAFHRDGTPIYDFHSTDGLDGATYSKLVPADTGSPGDAKLHFTTSPVSYGNSTYQYPIVAVSPTATAATLSATGLPSFLTLTPAAGGKGTLANNRALTIEDAGEYLIHITATSGTASTVQEFLLTIFNSSPSVILNEYNAVAAGSFLNGGNLATDQDGGVASADTYFGRVAGNGGRWAEFVVLGNGGTGTLDMRGWSVEIGTNTGTGFTKRNTLVLSSHADWQAVPSGTILTFIDGNTAHGGLDTGFALRDRSATIGDIWTNIWMGDSTYLTYTNLATNGYSVSSGVVSGIVIDHSNTQFRVKNALGQVVFGPVGEGVAPRSGTSSVEIFELEGHPTTSVSPAVASSGTIQGYDDGASESTFGLPNTWLIGSTLTTQRFSVLTAPEIAVEQPVGTDLADGGSKSFGSSIAVGTSKSLTFTIKNTGAADLTGLEITKTGTNTADFTVSANPTAPVSAPSGTTTFTVMFAPKSAGSKTADIHIANNDDDEAPFDLKLTGSGYLNVPEIGVQQPVGSNLVDGTSTRNFSTIKIGKSSAAKTFTIKNTGKANLTGLAIVMKGLNPKDFVVTAPTKTTVAPGASATFTVKFKPTAKGTRKASLQLKNNDSNENPFDIKLTGVGAKA